MSDNSYEREAIAEILECLNEKGEHISSWDINALIDMLADVDIEKELLDQRENQKEAEEKRKAHVKEVTSMELPLEWENAFMQDERARGFHAASIADGLVYSLSNLGRVDIEYISLITGEDCKTVISSLKGSIYQNPKTWNECFYKGWETADEYLSGNMRKKLIEAEKANREYDGYFQENIEAIRKVLPRSADARDIYVTLGSPWIPTDIIDDFINELLGNWKKYWSEYIPRPEELLTRHDEITGTWEIPYKSRASYIPKLISKYNTRRINALHIIERTLNMKAIVITDEAPSKTDPGKTRRVINKAETLLAMEKQSLIIKEFKGWIWAEAKRKRRLEDIYEEKFGCVRKRTYDGSFLTFPGLSKEIELYPYQKNAVARIIFTQNTLLAHDVGAGKTYVMIAASMELKRMGISKKNMFVVPNNIVGQWESIFRAMYPEARLLVIEPKTFRPQNRKRILESIRNEDFDGIIIAYSSFEQIKLSCEYCYNALLAEKTRLSALSKEKNKANARLRRKIESITKELAKLQGEKEQEKEKGRGRKKESEAEIYFDELGITALFVDEAHNFKNVPIETQVNNVLGISAAGSKKCKDMLNKVRVVQKESENSRVIFASGTPITNSVTDVFVMQTYLQSGELALLEIQNFDSWLGMFAEKNIEFEVDVDTNSYRLATRFSKFHNLPELTMLLSQVADFHKSELIDGVPIFNGYTDSLIPKTSEFEAYLREISERAEDVRSGRVDSKTDNMLKITTDGRAAALDLRLAKDDAAFTYQSKVARCADNAADIYFKTMAQRSTQLIFCDISTPKEGFNIYDEVKRLLLLRGIPEEEIAFIHGTNTEAGRKALFSKVRAGKIRILLGSTFKLGLGVNVQDRLIAIHHLDVPWRPADMTQREGRILRQGNRNPEVKIFRYITEGSFDAYSWQLLETKQKFISGLLSGEVNRRNSPNIDNTVLGYSEVKALAIGNPLIKKRVEIANELSRLITLQNKYIEERIAMQRELLRLAGLATELEEKIKACEEDTAAFLTAKENIKTDSAKEEAGKRKNLREKIHLAIGNNILETKERRLLSYRGFDIILPANMTKERPFIYLKGKGKYYVELGENSAGNLMRIDNFLDNFDRYLEKLNLNLSKLKEKEAELRRALSKEENFAGRIEDCKKRLIVIDKELGVENKE